MGLDQANLLAQIFAQPINFTADLGLFRDDLPHFQLGLILFQFCAIELGPDSVPLQRDSLQLDHYPLASLLKRLHLLIHLGHAGLQGRKALLELGRVRGTGRRRLRAAQYARRT